ncbi:TetR/AcrR family transcriptional regulator [Sedimentitalea nanhaiensis]|uniref:Transcriptional regulator, TetR family n=1 Tax=Sedimentitalea nanhaiensis TaxID=999627 RepID=A0A1I7DFI4_9RHOB|nr:TetR/AcrR family transcriptional regulator [Sedimentitalea nanhaiensis]SFU10450.1 transcriptional regulator, TetR family [Sedimentitalea nanhaiensis]
MTERTSSNPPPNRQEQRSEDTRRRVCDAAVSCLDDMGYSETSIQRVQERAEVSRGALMHQFATKEDLMADTLSRLLAPTRTGKSQNAARRNTVARGVSMENDLLSLWSKVVDRPEGRAMVEILVTARTDKKLRDKVEPVLKKYNDDINQDILRVYQSTNGTDEDVVELWAICRVFLRSLHLQERFTSDPEAAQKMISRFAKLVAPHMRRRQPEPDQ